MKVLTQTFLKGLPAFLPVFLTLYALSVFVAWPDHGSSTVLSWLMPDLPYVPGLGLVLGVAAILALGVVVTSKLTRGPIGSSRRR